MQGRPRFFRFISPLIFPGGLRGLGGIHLETDGEGAFPGGGFTNGAWPDISDGAGCDGICGRLPV